MGLRTVEQATELEALLRGHPCVRQASIFLWESAGADRDLVAYVVPHDECVDPTSACAEDESRRIEKWRRTYDLTQLGKASDLSEAGFNIRGWNSTYTRLPIPKDHMCEWVDLTVQEILRCGPSEVLELGCGTGLLLLRLARRCQRYVGVDNARVVLKTVKQQMKQLGGEWPQVELLERPADHFDGLEVNSFDTVILNSVAQYFPSLRYLLNVLEKAVRVTKPGGRIFLGDLRSLPLRGPFATSVELFQARAAMSVAELRERVRKRMRLDEELILSPTLFLALGQRWRKISRVEPVPKRGRCDNEMNRFRFNAILHLGAEPREQRKPTWISWPQEKLTFESLKNTLKKQNPESLGFTEVPNRRTWKDALAFRNLQSRNGEETVSSLKKGIGDASNCGVDPQDLWSLGDEAGYNVQISWAASRTDGSYEVVFDRKRPDSSSNGVTVAWPALPPVSDDLESYAQAPTRAVAKEKLLQQLRAYCEQSLPETMRPKHIVLLKALPLARDGKPDSQMLPSPEGVDVSNPASSWGQT